jgi:predicted MFS family arabinose efflux permease
MASAPSSSSPGRTARLSGGLMVLLALTSFMTGASMHFHAPMLGQMGAEFGADEAAVGRIATLTFAGYLGGMVFIIPLGDRMDKRHVILGQLVVVMLGCAAMAMAPSLAVAAALGFLIGLGACLTQGIIPLIAELTGPGERGKAIGTLMSALFIGILFGRVAGGFMASQFGWRWAFLSWAALLLLMSPMLFRSVPHSAPKTGLGYAALLRSLWPLWRSNRELRHASTIQFLLGLGYGSFWATIALMMMLVHGLGPVQAGLIGIPGAAGVLIARPAGRWMDVRGPYPVVSLGISLVLAAFIALLFGARWITALVIGAALLDSGLRSAMVANQTLVSSFSAEARSRVTTLFISQIWAGNAVGAFIGSTALKHGGWQAMCTLSILFVLAALALQLRAGRPRSSHP